ncbi:SIS domain-containing protein, partial [Paenibacillus sp. AR247]
MLQIMRYFQAVTDNLVQVLQEQHEAMQQTSHVLADTVEQGGSIYITGCSHSSLFA